ncbi:glycosyltransferase family 4 protein [Spectribacter hydrogenoxidans]|uniref:Glycosyltransferase family 4 protein n=1 Tax=Spectribacter hydrogenoxidans TaxID=3075608 RepID=A0ABU3C462_9GAMM|nr:glycosyltransferase family 4 protein [Salinisphaera sp. W335]MDT0636362.1 glycosyltransferase family 4 protein [Salinisphaera sp. W335]
MKVVHMTTVHQRTDTRILIKQCKTLAKASDMSISLFVQDGREDCVTHHVRTVGVGKVSGGRLRRATQGAWRMYRAVRKAKPTLAHFHDPELIPVGVALKLSRIKVIYDVHEDLRRQIRTKHWIPKWVRPIVARGAACIEWVAGRAFDAIVPATPKIAGHFPAAKTIVVQNFPLLDELVVPEAMAYAQRPKAFAYVGGISEERGIFQILEAVALVNGRGGARLELAGAFIPDSLKTRAAASDGWSATHFHGWTSRKELSGILANVRAGLVVLHPNGRYEDAYPVKMFEYMAAGLPVIASDFPLWRQIIEDSRCGLLVDPLDPKAVADAMQWILEHPEEAEKMGQRGRMAVVEKYNWETEAKKLIALYERLLPSTTVSA